MDIVLAGNNIDQKIQAACALTMTNLASDHFGLAMEIDHGLQSLIIAADLGSVPYQALVLRFHEAFGRPIPESVKDKIEGWLCAAAATGSLTALEDRRVHGYIDSANESLRLLQTRYCGVGEEIFEYDAETDRILQSSNETEVLSYIKKEIKIGQDAGQDISGYLLRIAASYGNALAIKILAYNFSADVDDLNAMNGDHYSLQLILATLRHSLNYLGLDRTRELEIIQRILLLIGSVHFLMMRSTRLARPLYLQAQISMHAPTYILMRMASRMQRWIILLELHCTGLEQEIILWL
jgi:hypothetical protein